MRAFVSKPNVHSIPHNRYYPKSKHLLPLNVDSVARRAATRPPFEKECPRALLNARLLSIKCDEKYQEIILKVPKKEKNTTSERMKKKRKERKEKAKNSKKNAEIHTEQEHHGAKNINSIRFFTQADTHNTFAYIHHNI